MAADYPFIIFHSFTLFFTILLSYQISTLGEDKIVSKNIMTLAEEKKCFKESGKLDLSRLLSRLSQLLLSREETIIDFSSSNKFVHLIISRC